MTRRSGNRFETNQQLENPESLFYELRRIANINQDFRSGAAGLVTFKTHQAEQMRPSDTADPDFDGKWPTPYISESYEFSATREPLPSHDRIMRFMYSFSSTLHGIVLPRHIAEDVYGLEGQEAVESAGPSMREHGIAIELDEDDMELRLCESVTYTDQEGDDVLRVCSCPTDHTTEMSSIFHKTDITESDDSALGYNLGRQLQFDARAARQFEVIDANTVNPDEQALALQLGGNIDEDRAAYDMQLASEVLQSMKTALRKQLRIRL